MKNSISIRKITLAALLTVVSIILTRVFSLYVPIAAFPSLRIGFGSIPIMLAGVVLGPVYGGIVGGIADALGLFIFPNGYAYFFGFTINAVLQGVFSGILTLLLKKIKTVKINDIMNIILFVGVISLLGIFLIFNDSFKLNKDLVINFSLVGKIFTLLGFSLYFIFLYLAIIYIRKRSKNALRTEIISLCTTIVFINEFILVVILSAVWKQMVFGIPFLINIFVQLLMMLVNIPLKIFFLSLLVETTRKLYIEENYNLTKS